MSKVESIHLCDIDYSKRESDCDKLLLANLQESLDLLATWRCPTCGRRASGIISRQPVCLVNHEGRPS